MKSEEIKAMLDQGLFTRRQLGEVSGLPHGSVGAIVNGWRPVPAKLEAAVRHLAAAKIAPRGVRMIGGCNTAERIASIQ